MYEKAIDVSEGDICLKRRIYTRAISFVLQLFCACRNNCIAILFAWQLVLQTKNSKSCTTLGCHVMCSKNLQIFLNHTVRFHTERFKESFRF